MRQAQHVRKNGSFLHKLGLFKIFVYDVRVTLVWKWALLQQRSSELRWLSGG